MLRNESPHIDDDPEWYGSYAGPRKKKPAKKKTTYKKTTKKKTTKKKTTKKTKK